MSLRYASPPVCLVMSFGGKMLWIPWSIACVIFTHHEVSACNEVINKDLNSKCHCWVEVSKSHIIKVGYITMDIDNANSGVAMNHRQLRLHRRHCYQAFIIIHLKGSTDSRKASVQPRRDIPLTVEESTWMLRFKKESIATILDAVIFQQAGTWPYATALIIPPHQIQILHSWTTWMGWLWSDFNIAIIDQVVQFWKMNSIDILHFFNEICEWRCRNQYHPDCNETRTIDIT